MRFRSEELLPPAARRWERVEAALADPRVFEVSDSRSLNGLAWYFAIRNEPDRGLPLAARAVEADPRCTSCLDTLALLELEAGRPKAAVSTEQRAAERMSDQDVRAQILVSLARYKELAGTASATTTVSR
jgi:hypothetical protein